ncbi:hypothetical protein GALMADRAFT_141110 [Galerina marginata CBS 339.88]|uniref:DUF6534 domain-containing protein n=1 Tax=Galerina marginata (strain CBS 339.88) TaxID=685588 RepID=A0A067SV55_GALM3|nr:hypothetical protein GALMADRAFT_141110 [Galerina marginata CBS 339.88]
MTSTDSGCEVHSTLGALLIGLFVSSCLFGIGTVQTYIYYTQFRNDKMHMKIMVLSMWPCELGHCICLLHAFYTIVIHKYWQQHCIETIPTSMVVSIALSGVIGTVVQIFFIERVRNVSGRIIIPIACWIASMTRFVLTLVMTRKAVTVNLNEFDRHLKWLCVTVLALGAAVDFFVAVSLSYYLKARRINGFPVTSLMIDKITAWTIQTGVLTSLAGLCMLVLFVVIPENFIWLAIFMSLSRLFSNSLLALLNGRAGLREETFFEIRSWSRAKKLLPRDRSGLQGKKMKKDSVYKHGIF